ncbi:hypothetical protein PROFUN_00657 [Planoprotostelium fungivorum]|uniref:Uncharacterized protein n=1 Tax=Planoprotostelium fungivorum TaxID=1890364 RepID=A0A2P6NU33_9EUKA|nr:hypothetical protein PROFUN_00657 [Planoprotostelium fungivorum]
MAHKFRLRIYSILLAAGIQKARSMLARSCARNFALRLTALSSYICMAGGALTGANKPGAAKRDDLLCVDKDDTSEPPEVLHRGCQRGTLPAAGRAPSGSNSALNLTSPRPIAPIQQYGSIDRDEEGGTDRGIHVCGLPGQTETKQKTAGCQARGEKEGQQPRCTTRGKQETSTQDVKKEAEKDDPQKTKKATETLETYCKLVLGRDTSHSLACLTTISISGEGHLLCEQQKEADRHYKKISPDPPPFNQREEDQLTSHSEEDDTLEHPEGGHVKPTSLWHCCLCDRDQFSHTKANSERSSRAAYHSGRQRGTVAAAGRAQCGPNSLLQWIERTLETVVLTLHDSSSNEKQTQHFLMHSDFQPFATQNPHSRSFRVITFEKVSQAEWRETVVDTFKPENTSHKQAEVTAITMTGLTAENATSSHLVTTQNQIAVIPPQSEFRHQTIERFSYTSHTREAIPCIVWLPWERRLSISFLAGLHKTNLCRGNNTDNTSTQDDLDSTFPRDNITVDIHVDFKFFATQNGSGFTIRITASCREQKEREFLDMCPVKPGDNQTIKIGSTLAAKHTQFIMIDMSKPSNIDQSKSEWLDPSGYVVIRVDC